MFTNLWTCICFKWGPWLKKFGHPWIMAYWRGQFIGVVELQTKLKKHHQKHASVSISYIFQLWWATDSWFVFELGLKVNAVWCLNPQQSSCSLSQCPSKVNKERKHLHKIWDRTRGKDEGKAKKHTIQTGSSDPTTVQAARSISDYKNTLRARSPGLPLRAPALLGASRESSSRLSNLIVINARG